MTLIYLKSAQKSDSFDVSISIKIPFFRISITTEPGRSLLKVRYPKLFENKTKKKIYSLYYFHVFTFGVK